MCLWVDERPVGMFIERKRQLIESEFNLKGNLSEKVMQNCLTSPIYEIEMFKCTTTIKGKPF